MSSEIMAKILKVMELALQLNPEKTEHNITGNKPTVFVKFSGHIASLEVVIYQSGWKEGRENTTYRMYFEEEWDNSENTLDRVIETLEKLVKEWGVKNE